MPSSDVRDRRAPSAGFSTIQASMIEAKKAIWKTATLSLVMCAPGKGTLGKFVTDETLYNNSRRQHEHRNGRRQVEQSRQYRRETLQRSPTLRQHDCIHRRYAKDHRGFRKNTKKYLSIKLSFLLRPGGSPYGRLGVPNRS